MVTALFWSPDGLSGESISPHTLKMAYYVYILASGRNGTLYIGVTSDLVRRVFERKEKAVPGFTRTHGVDRLVYFEQLEDPEHAIRREKRLKRYKRDWKINLIDRTNPEWVDLFESIARRAMDLPDKPARDEYNFAERAPDVTRGDPKRRRVSPSALLQKYSRRGGGCSAGTACTGPG